MMFSNHPVMLQQQDFHDRHSDMLAAAKDGVTIDSAVKLTIVDKPANLPYVHAKSPWFELFAHPETKIGAVLRIRMPKDCVVKDGPRLTVLDLGDDSYTRISLRTRYAGGCKGWMA